MYYLKTVFIGLIGLILLLPVLISSTVILRGKLEALCGRISRKSSAVTCSRPYVLLADSVTAVCGIADQYASGHIESQQIRVAETAYTRH